MLPASSAKTRLQTLQTKAVWPHGELAGSQTGDSAVDVEVSATHIGMVLSPLASSVLARKLAENESLSSGLCAPHLTAKFHGANIAPVNSLQLAILEGEL